MTSYTTVVYDFRGHIQNNVNYNNNKHIKAGDLFQMFTGVIIYHCRPNPGPLVQTSVPGKQVTQAEKVGRRTNMEMCGKSVP